jgi:hypothetical protein
MKNPRDIYDDGHGFRAVSQGGSPARRREVMVHRYAFSRDVRKRPRHNRPFLGLYETSTGDKEVFIIWRADKPEAGLHFLTWERSEFPHYIQDPIAWAEFPDYE